MTDLKILSKIVTDFTKSDLIRIQSDTSRIETIVNLADASSLSGLYLTSIQVKEIYLKKV